MNATLVAAGVLAAPPRPAQPPPARPARRLRTGHVDEVRAGEKLISGGSSDSEPNDWQVNPIGPSSPAAVTTTTPVAKCPRTSRIAAPSTAASVGWVVMPTSCSPGAARPAVARTRAAHSFASSACK